MAYRIIRTPYAWGEPMKRELLLRLPHFLQGKPFDLKRQILFCITKKDFIGVGIPKNPFKNCVIAKIKSFS